MPEVYGYYVEDWVSTTLASFEDIKLINFFVRPLKVFLPTRNFNKNLKIINSFVEPFVKRTIQLKPEELKEKTEKSYNFLHALAEFTTDERMLRDQLISVLLAARDTTAATLSWALYELSLQPELVEKLRTEILDTVGPSKVPSYTDLKDMKFVQSVINETLRLYPAGELVFCFMSVDLS